MVAVMTGSVVGFAFLSHLSTWFVRETALDGVRREADLLEGINAYYSEDVVGRLDTDEIKVTHEYAQMKNALPAPKTFIIDAAERISADVAGMQVRLYSDHPWRQDGGPKNDFKRRTARQKLDTRGQMNLGDWNADGLTDLLLFAPRTAGVPLRLLISRAAPNQD